MFNVSRNVVLAAIAVSVLAGCKTTTTRECDTLKPGTTTYHGKCCGVGDAPCREGRGGGTPGGGNTPDPTPQ